MKGILMSKEVKLLKKFLKKQTNIVNVKAKEVSGDSHAFFSAMNLENEKDL